MTEAVRPEKERPKVTYGKMGKIVYVEMSWKSKVKRERVGLQWTKPGVDPAKLAWYIGSLVRKLQKSMGLQHLSPEFPRDDQAAISGDQGTVLTPGDPTAPAGGDDASAAERRGDVS